MSIEKKELRDQETLETLKEKLELLVRYSPEWLETQKVYRELFLKSQKKEEKQ